MEQTISVLADDDFTRLAKQVLRVQSLATQHLNRSMKRDASDLDALQALLDSKVLKPTDTFDLQCLGIVLGMCLVEAIDGLDWAIVEDEYGRDPALRYQTSSLLLFPLTMISKRVEDGRPVDIHELVKQTRESVSRLKAQVAWPN